MIVDKEFVTEYATEFKRLIGISDDWRIVLKWDANQPEYGLCCFNVIYRNATITFNLSILDCDERAKEVIQHELWHIRLSDLQNVFNTAINELPTGQGGVYKEWMTNVRENLIQSLVRSMTREIHIKEVTIDN